jgi:hypothetical protein
MEIIWIALVYIVFTFASTYVHELGHALSAILLGAKEVVIAKDRKGLQMSFKTYFSFYRSITRLENVVISFSGVILQFIFSIILAVQPFSVTMAMISLIYIPNIFINILPFTGLDGYYVVKDMGSKIRGILFFVFYISWFISLYLILHLILNSQLYYIVLYMSLLVFLWVRIVMKLIKYTIRERRIEYEGS